MSGGCWGGIAVGWGRRPRDKAQSCGYRAACSGQSDSVRVRGLTVLGGVRESPTEAVMGAKDKESWTRSSSRKGRIIQMGKSRLWFKCRCSFKGRVS